MNKGGNILSAREIHVVGRWEGVGLWEDGGLILLVIETQL